MLTSTCALEKPPPCYAFPGSCRLLLSVTCEPFSLVTGILDSHSLQHWAEPFLGSTEELTSVVMPSAASGFPPHHCDTCFLLSLLELLSSLLASVAFTWLHCSSSSFCACGLFSHVLPVCPVPSPHVVPDAVQLDITGAHRALCTAVSPLSFATQRP